MSNNLRPSEQDIDPQETIDVVVERFGAERAPILKAVRGDAHRFVYAEEEVGTLQYRSPATARTTGCRINTD